MPCPFLISAFPVHLPIPLLFFASCSCAPLSCFSSAGDRLPCWSGFAGKFRRVKKWLLWHRLYNHGWPVVFMFVLCAVIHFRFLPLIYLHFHHVLRLMSFALHIFHFFVMSFPFIYAFIPVPCSFSSSYYNSWNNHGSGVKTTVFGQWAIRVFRYLRIYIY